MPWDQPGEIQKILTALNPSSFYFGRTDLWPELIYQLFLRSVRTYILSYNPNLRFLNQLWSRIFLKNFSGLFCTHVSQEDMLKKILPDSVLIKTPGDTRYDQVFWRLRQPTKIPFQILSEYFVLGSTWPEDESVILPALKEIKNLGYKIILSPHEIDSVNINRLAKLITELNLSCEKFSELNSVDAEVILVDKVGYLADFYRDCSGAFIGGSFKSKVHSVMEPLCCAVPVITGPKIYNSPEALQYHQVIMNELRVVQSVRTTTEFLNAVKKIKNTNKADFKKLLIGHLEKNRYATQKIMTFIVE